MRNFHYGTVFLLEEDFADDYLRACFSAMRGLDMNTVVLWPPVFYRPDGAREAEGEEDGGDEGEVDAPEDFGGGGDAGGDAVLGGPRHFGAEDL